MPCLDDGTQMQTIRCNAITDSSWLIANGLRVDQLWYHCPFDRTETVGSAVGCDAVANELFRRWVYLHVDVIFCFLLT
jgi:hypothetical protein